MDTSVLSIYNDLSCMGVDVGEVHLKANTAIAFLDGYIALDKRKCPTSRKERTILVHEAGHYISGAFYKAFSKYQVREQAEQRAFAASVEKYLPIDKIKKALSTGNTEVWQLAEYFNLDEEYIEKALHYWKECRGEDFNW